MRMREAVWAVAAVISVGGCGNGMDGGGATTLTPGSAPTADPEAAWMDEAEVRVTENLCAGSSKVELVNAAAGQQAVLDTETFPPDPSCHQS